MALTKDDIWRAADELDEDGTRPTLAAVRKKLGRGSFTTIQDAMSEWKHRQQESTRTSGDPPPEVGERARALAAELWVVAFSAADRALAGERVRIAEQEAMLRTQLAEAAEAADELGAEVECLKQDLADAHGQCAAQEAMIADLAEAQRTAAAEAYRLKDAAAAASVDAKEARSAEKAALQKAARAEGEIKALREQVATFASMMQPTIPAEPELDLASSPTVRPAK